eukprot:NODE_6831_length_1634_cov_7.147976.p1 GENE.NODE_6831_length_1634_cov_7.147976~~NODE_6831_length_1634_cov_7.147976.p1  ORF type:complete len:447 (+),score=124.36 NODE_6831_length_1634_cov_7.147976:111-1451(+)
MAGADGACASGAGAEPSGGQPATVTLRPLEEFIRLHDAPEARSAEGGADGGELRGDRGRGSGRGGSRGRGRGGENFDLKYRDISTGQGVAAFKMPKGGGASCMRQNPANAVMHVGHPNGTVSLWTPNHKEPVVNFWCQPDVTALAVHDNYMVTAGGDSTWKVWDLRTYRQLRILRCRGHPIVDVDISATGLVAIGFGPHFEVWRGIMQQPSSWPYLKQEYPADAVTSVRFKPFEDVCGVGLSSGFAGVVVPGAGYANFDSYEANPFATKKELREREIRSLLDKLQPTSIMLDPTRLGQVDQAISRKLQDEQTQRAKEAKEEEKKNAAPTNKKRGKNKVGKRLGRKKGAKTEEQRSKTRKRLRDAGLEGRDGDGSGDDGDGSGDDDDAGAAAGSAGGDTGDEDADGRAGARPRHAAKRKRGPDVAGAAATAGVALGRFANRKRPRRL